ncbi:iron uptake transporter deferrochelatase/peroxidase subunit [Streptomyces beihaiensis]|uniref:Deferrochelatase n=1 Tax=Streptomyces beihaiensis TaxID=2984495 RepID=A0ABT3TXF0_9ACTN|nr:iron uptake transporter deferrochelatase/peroxidase subunit [Streptomyces beihaiensis]MCX3061062.1 iron uptake transporter deferrochelatase/peroxidase subunit [Streptomyces beihaiensis]
MNVSRRRFLHGAAAGAGTTALAGGMLIAGAHADADAASGGGSDMADSYPFHGAHQAGVLTPKQRASCYVAFDVTAQDRAGLVGLMKTLTARARHLTTGGAPADLGVGQPPADSDVLGPDVPADGLTVTVSFGASLFDGEGAQGGRGDRFGIARHKPLRLAPMRIFKNDSPEPAWMHGDLLLQICANHPDTVHHAIRDITRHTRGAMQMRWKIDGYNSPPRPSGTGRNLLGFKDGTANPTGSTAADLVWVDDSAEPAWAQGGSYQVVRLIRMLVEFWDRVSINEQENMFGRRRDSGAPLDGTHEFDTPDYSADPHGKVIPLDSHMRLANPRTKPTANQRLLRRSFNYDLGVDTNGNLRTGHIFTCYQQDLVRQFETVQERLVDEPLVDYVQPFGGGYFFALPGVTDHRDWYARQLLA